MIVHAAALVVGGVHVVELTSKGDVEAVRWMARRLRHSAVAVVRAMARTLTA